MKRITRPDSQIVDFTYEDTMGKLKDIVLPEGIQILTYSSTTGQLTQVTHPNGSQLAYTYQGSLLQSETWSGLLSGSVQQEYNNDLRVKNLKVNNVNPILYSYDDDGLLIGAGELSLTRDAENGLLRSTQLKQVTTALTYTPFGELESETVKFGGNVLYQVTYPLPDKLGRTTTKVEQLGTETRTEEYDYDLRGFLREVKPA